MSLCQNFALRVLKNKGVWNHFSKKCLIRASPTLTCKLHTGNTYNAQDIDDKLKQTPYPFMSNLKGNTTVKHEPIEMDEAWEWQGAIIFGCFAVFFIYILFFRKEREVDKAIEQQLYLGMPALEVYDLRKAIKKNKEKGLDTEELEKRLKVVLTPPQNRNL